MKKLLFKQFYVLLACLIALSSCNHEGPIQVVNADQLNQVVTDVSPYNEFVDNPMVDYHIMLPTDVLPNNVAQLSPWVYVYRAGMIQKFVINPQDVYKDYYNHYAFTLSLPLNEEANIFVNYGNQACNCSYPTPPKVCGTDIFAVPYYVTEIKGRKSDTVFAFHLGQAQIKPIDKSIIKALDAEMREQIGSTTNYYWLANQHYTADVGVRNVRWVFPDGYVYNSSIDGVVEHRPKKSGNVQVTLTDNLGNEQMIQPYPYINKR